MPPEVLHFELMREMGWSFAQLQETPAYVVRYCSDLMLIRRDAEAEHARKSSEAQRGP
jgi:hypothetical protein